jgi:D-xylonolactonase
MDAPRCIWPAEAMLGEGTLWSAREQALYWVDILGKRLHRCRNDGGGRQSWDFDE